MARRRSSSFLAGLILLLASLDPALAQGGFSLDQLPYILSEVWAFVTLRIFGPSCKTLPVVNNFDLDRFIAFSWFVQRKQVNEYQDYSELFCITETYVRMEQGKDKLQAVKTLTSQGGGGADVNGYVADMMCVSPWGKGGQFKIVLCMLPEFLLFLGGPYWVVDTDYDSYAIITGGPLTERGSCDDFSGLCTLPIRGEFIDPGSWFGQRQGLYYFTRAKDPTPELMRQIEQKALAMGICTAHMLDVVHEGCTYKESPLFNPKPLPIP